MEIKIEKNCPMPGEWIKSQSVEKYPLSKMEVGDSFMVTEKDFVSAPSFRSYIYKEGPKMGAKFATRKNSKGDIRVWRIA